LTSLPAAPTLPSRTSVMMSLYSKFMIKWWLTCFWGLYFYSFCHLLLSSIFCYPTILSYPTTTPPVPYYSSLYFYYYYYYCCPTTNTTAATTTPEWWLFS
jgi:hypothetical protein